jgi:hypothetical protein
VLRLSAMPGVGLREPAGDVPGHFLPAGHRFTSVAVWTFLSRLGSATCGADIFADQAVPSRHKEKAPY